MKSIVGTIVGASSAATIALTLMAGAAFAEPTPPFNRPVR